MAILRIGSRESKLALYQAKLVRHAMTAQGLPSQLISITTEGDLDTDTPIYEMGIQGIFTRSLDAALLSNRIDLAVHSAKDIPTKLAQGLVIGAILERGDVTDSLVCKPGEAPDFSKLNRIASGSIRRMMQWRYRYPYHTMENVRGNIETRLSKLAQSDWQGMLISTVALQRLGIKGFNIVTLDWMLPSPAQGAIAVVCREDDKQMVDLCQALNHAESYACVTIEREFLTTIQGGCSVPIAGLVVKSGNSFHINGAVFSLDAKKKAEVSITIPEEEAVGAGKLAALDLLKNGGEEIVKTFRRD